MKRKRQIRSERFFKTRLNDQQVGGRDHQYDLTGGFDPLDVLPRLDRWGYLLILGAILGLITSVFGISARSINWYTGSFMVACVLFFFVIGVMLIKKHQKSESHSEQDGGHGKRDD
jgi:hypothetical protein